MEEIKKYLNGKKKDFDKGLILLRKYCRNRILVNNVERRKLQGKMEYELRKISKWEPKVVAPTPPPPPPVLDPPIKEDSTPHIPSPKTCEAENAVTTRARVQSLDLEKLPEPLLVRYHENTKMYKECRSLHEKLKIQKDEPQEVLKPLCEELVTLDKKIRANWNAIDEHLKTPEKSDTGDTGDQPADHKMINAARSYISRNKKKLAEESDKVKAADLRAKVQHRVTQLVNAGEGFTDDLIVELKAMGINFDAVNAGAG